MGMVVIEVLRQAFFIDGVPRRTIHLNKSDPWTTRSPGVC